MRRRILQKLTYANVMATLGVFLALGGGYAVATIQGNGNAVFNGNANKLNANYKTIANVPGIVRVNAACAGEVLYRIKNTSSKTLLMHRGTGGGTFDYKMQPGESEDFFNDGVQTQIFHVYRARGDMTPAALVTISSFYPNSCEGAYISVAALGGS